MLDGGCVVLLSLLLRLLGDLTMVAGSSSILASLHFCFQSLYKKMKTCQ